MISNRRARRPRAALLFTMAVLVGVSLLLASSQVVLSTSQPQIMAAFVDEVPHTDPNSPLWDEARVFEASTIPQVVAVPRMPQVKVPTIDVRALHDGEHVAFLLAWDAPEPSWYATASDQFPDQAAIQFAVDDVIPAICMGTVGQRVNIWNWKADWQWDIDNHFRDVTDEYPHFYTDLYPYVRAPYAEPPFTFPDDFSEDAVGYNPGTILGNVRSETRRTTPIEDTVSEGFGRLETRLHQSVEGKGEWSDGRWRVVFSRPFETDGEDAPVFQTGREISAAFAVWSGQHQNRGAQKQLSSVLTLMLEPNR